LGAAQGTAQLAARWMNTNTSRYALLPVGVLGGGGAEALPSLATAHLYTPSCQSTRMPPTMARQRMRARLRAGPGPATRSDDLARVPLARPARARCRAAAARRVRGRAARTRPQAAGGTADAAKNENLSILCLEYDRDLTHLGTWLCEYTHSS